MSWSSSLESPDGREADFVTVLISLALVLRCETFGQGSFAGSSLRQ